MVTFATYAASTETLKVVVTEIHFCLVTVKACPRVHAGVARAAKRRGDAIIVCFAEDLVSCDLIESLEI